VSKKSSYIGGSTVVRVYESDKRLTERQAHWRRKRGIDRIEQCVQGVGEVTEEIRLIKSGDPRQRPQRTKRSRRSAEQSKPTDDMTVQDGLGQKLKRKIRAWRIHPKTGEVSTS
jgi:hypothetical protein